MMRDLRKEKGNRAGKGEEEIREEAHLFLLDLKDTHRQKYFEVGRHAYSVLHVSMGQLPGCPPKSTIMLLGGHCLLKFKCNWLKPLFHLEWETQHTCQHFQRFTGELTFLQIITGPNFLFPKIYSIVLFQEICHYSLDTTPFIFPQNTVPCL